MHELSLANEICDIVEREVMRERDRAALALVTLVSVEVGVQFNVEPDNLQFCLDALLSSHPFQRGRAVLETVPGDDLRVGWFEIDDEADIPFPGGAPAWHAPEGTT
jgi:Zn finger protein HypA/HybF involved in hydrogenase expression